MEKINELFGERLAIEMIDGKTFSSAEIYTGKGDENHKFAKVIYIGDGMVKGEKKKMHIKVGDIVFFAGNAFTTGYSTYQFNDGRVFDIILQSEVLGKIKKLPATLETFEPCGLTVLLDIKVETEVGGILIPEKYQHDGTKRKVDFEILKFGSAVKHLKKGQQALVDRARAQVFVLAAKGESGVITQKKFAYCSSDNIHGVTDFAG